MDASEVAYGGYIVGIGGEVAHENWTLEESGKSSTWCELAAVERMLRAFAPQFTGGAVCWFTDNQAVSWIVEVGSKKAELQSMAMAIFQTSTSLLFSLAAVPSGHNCNDYRIVSEYVLVVAWIVKVGRH